MLGYRLDSGSGQLSQGALLQFDSIPGGADIAVDDVALGRVSKHTTLAGTRTVNMSLNGYQDWNRTLDVAAGTLTWLDYIRFVPVERPIQTITTHLSLNDAIFTNDGTWALLLEKSDIPTFQLVDLRSDEPKISTVSLPQTVYSEPTGEGVVHNFDIVGWGSGDRYALLKHNYGDKLEWLVFDTQEPARTVNITRLLAVGFKDIKFNGANGTSFYGLTDDGTIREIDLSAATISRALVTQVASFSLFDDKIVSYIGTSPTDANKSVAGVYRDGDAAAQVLHTASADGATLKIAVGKYFNDDYVAIAENDVVTVLKGDYPSASSQNTDSLAEFASFTLNSTITSLSFSPNGNYILMQSGAVFRSFEIEHMRSASGSIATSQDKPASSLAWLDGAHLWNDDGGKLLMRDFNDINTFEIMEVESGFDARLSQNGRFFYAVGRGDEGYHLQRVRMILN